MTRDRHTGSDHDACIQQYPCSSWASPFGERAQGSRASARASGVERVIDVERAFGVERVIEQI